MPPQQQQRDPSEAKCKPVLVDLRGAGDEGAGKKQWLQGQQEQQSEDCCACGDEREEDEDCLLYTSPSPRD